MDHTLPSFLHNFVMLVQHTYFNYFPLFYRTTLLCLSLISIISSSYPRNDLVQHIQLTSFTKVQTATKRHSSGYFILNTQHG